MKNPASQTRVIIENFLKFLSERDLEQITNLYADDVDWHIPGDETKVSWLGKRNCKEDVKQFYKLLWSNTEPVSAHINNIYIDSENAVITGEFSTKMLQTGNVVDSMFCIEMIIENNLITKYILLEDSYAVSRSLTRT